MVYRSARPDAAIPDVDVYHYLFEGEDRPPDDMVFLIDADTDRRLTFKELRSMTKRFASALTSKFGARPGDVLAIVLANDILYSVIYFGAMAAGLVVTTMNPAYTIPEMAHQLVDSGARYIVTDKAALAAAQRAANEAHVPSDRMVVIGADTCVEERLKYRGWQSLDTFLSGTLEATPVKLPPGKAESTVALICYTSGTTGKSKGAQITHRNLVAGMSYYVANEADHYRAFPQPAVQIGFVPLYHIFGLTTLLHLPLCRRSVVVVMRRYQFTRMLELTQNYRASLLHVAPPICVALATSPLVDEYNLSSLREVISASAPLTAELIDSVRKRLCIDVRQYYGMTELTMMTHATRPEDPKKDNIGVLVPNVQAKLVDAQGHEVADGERGELCIRSPGMMKGYINNPEATAACIDEDGFLHTGDVAYVDEQGRFYIVDRIKELIKYKGFQVAPAELEEILLAHPDVADVAVIPVDCPEQATELPRAMVVLKPDHAPTTTEASLVGYVAERVVNYKQLRGGVVFIKEIPYSPAGKRLRRVLRDQERKRAHAASQPGGDRRIVREQVAVAGQPPAAVGEAGGRRVAGEEGRVERVGRLR
ncbi:hypothetical protein SYNPS1DRAFT_32953 [Syncephalis pseudoplumigaleata]|uniref:4-coumarate-CoA ligase n=1 Tax=Syncephalis pseudoplumigaleata TaxID=1712513 RepID=A0A4P9Z1A8_9FUNG|nr:hypothetical protein SYNPS1DRAFT_32953 [Syncephalis pseudoplumigaleata]|eukprot:RKP25521.1 hypothetical protein SYNPS1DRAFT_32953 [Syncephalis pseudoplumigaleata]